MIYPVCSTLLLIGVLGLFAQAMLGGGHAGHLGGHSHAGHMGGHAQAGSHAHAGENQGASRGPSPLWTLLSPLTFFSLCIGAGATGLILKHLHLATLWVSLAALAGGLLFYGLVMRPLWGFVFRFASTPSRALAGAVAGEAEALSSFDEAGKGLVRLTIDGQLVRVLATLEPDAAPAAPVRPGERLTVTSVDGRTNSCRVTRL